MQKNTTMSCCNNSYPDVSLEEFEHICLTDYTTVTALVHSLTDSILPIYFRPSQLASRDLEVC